MPADASGLTDDAAALLSVWVMVKDGGTWGAPGPPPWVVSKISRDKGTLVMGAPDERTSAAFRDAGITISGKADEKAEADYQNDLARGGGYAKEQADAK